MRKWIFALVCLFPMLAHADMAGRVLSDVYGSMQTACTQDADADTGEANPVAMAAGFRYIVYCHDGAGARVACTCLQGTSTVDASSSIGVMIPTTVQWLIVKQQGSNTHISCVPLVDNQYIDVCRLN